MARKALVDLSEAQRRAMAKYYTKNRERISKQKKEKYKSKPISLKVREKNKLAMRKYRLRKKMTSVITQIKELSAVDIAVEKVRAKRLLHHTEKILAEKLISHARRQRWRQCKKYLEEFEHPFLLKAA